MCARFRNEPQYQRHAAADGRSAKRVGVDAGEGRRPERRPDRHEQQQHIADTGLPSGHSKPPDGDGRRPVIAGGKSPAPRTPVTPVAATRPGPWRSVGRAVRAAGVRPVGHGLVRCHTRIQETVAGPTASGRRGGTDGHPAATATTAGTRCRDDGDAADGTAVGPLPTAGRPFGSLRFQTATVADQHGGRKARPAVGGRQAAAAAAAAAAVKGVDDLGIVRPSERRTAVVLEVERALFDNTGRLSRRRGPLRHHRHDHRRQWRYPKIRLAGQPHAQGISHHHHYRPNVFNFGNGPLTSIATTCTSTTISFNGY